MRIAAFVLLLVLIPPPQGGQAKIDDYGIITWDTTLPAPDTDRIVSLLDLFFELHPNTPKPESIKIQWLIYQEFEIELAQNEAGPNWRYWLRTYQRNASSRLVGGFVRGSKFSASQVEIVTFRLTDNTIIHEMSHWACHTLGPDIRSGPHTGAPWGDCTTAITNDLVHSLKFRNWLRDRPWRQ